MRTMIFITTLFLASSSFAAGTAADRWASAVGGRDKIAAIHGIYREATVEVGGFQGTLKVWHTPEGKYRKEEQVGPFSTIETFDGTNGMIQRGDTPARAMTAAEIERARSARFANSNAVFFVFFPERHKGTISFEGRDAITFRPEGGIEWHVTLDPKTSLPAAMMHKEGEAEVNVTFVSYETIDGVTLEQELRRTNGNPRFNAVIRFTRTTFNPPIDASLFSIAAKNPASAQPDAKP